MHKHTTHCTLCRLPIRPGEPAVTAAALDVADGRVVIGPARRHHARDGCRIARAAAALGAAA